MPKVKVCKSKREAMPGLEDMMKQFQSLEKDINSKDNLLIILDKFGKYQTAIHSFLSQLININSVLFSAGYTCPGLYEISVNMMKDYKKYSLDLRKYEVVLDPHSIADTDGVAIKMAYYDLTESYICESLMRICVNIKKSKAHTLELDAFADRCAKKELFLPIMEGLNWEPIASRARITASCTPVSNLDEYFAVNKDEVLKDLLKQSYEVGMELYHLRFLPDIDTSIIFDMILKILSGLKSKTRGNTRGLEIIERSRDLFEANFQKYYRNSKITQNPMTMINEFISDITTQNMESDVNVKDLNEVIELGKQMKNLIGNKLKNQTDGRAKKLMTAIDTLFDQISKPDAESAPIDMAGLQDQFKDLFEAE
jgi:hypothetical protein